MEKDKDKHKHKQKEKDEQKEKEKQETMDQQLFKYIQSSTYSRFEKHFFHKYKKPYQSSPIYTVICSIWIHQISSSKHLDQNNCKLISMANGTKSLPYSLYKQHNTFLLKDMHAQILCIKAFRSFILQQITKSHSEYFKLDPNNNKYEFNSKEFQIIMFSSQPFCGDCSINQNSNNFSGSKPLKYFNHNQIPNQKFQKHILRTKPGRIDLPLHKKSLSLSCSDKLALYNILGIQGKELFLKVKPVYIRKFLVQTKTYNSKIIQNGLSFVHRLSSIRGESKELIMRKILKIKIGDKERKISNQFTYAKPKVVCMQRKQNQSEDLVKKIEKQGFQVSLICSGLQDLQWINGRTGLPEGGSLKSYQKQRKVSKYSKCMFREKLQKTYISTQKQKQKQLFKYRAIKDRIKLLFEMWTDDFKTTNNQVQQNELNLHKNQ